jgi:hypothetical protein
MDYGLDYRSSIPGRDKRFFSSQRADRFWGPRRGLSWRVKRPGLDLYLCRDLYDVMLN